jgi:hypothetical protein
MDADGSAPGPDSTDGFNTGSRLVCFQSGGSRGVNQSVRKGRVMARLVLLNLGQSAVVALAWGALLCVAATVLGD